MSSGIIGFDKGLIQSRAKALLRSRKRKSPYAFLDYDHADYESLLRRFQNENDYGQAFKNKPSDAELAETLEWLTNIQ